MTSMANPPSLRRNVAYSALGRGYYAVTQFAVIALTARMGQVEDVGALTLASAIVTPLFFLTSMGMRDVHTVDDLDRFNRSDYVALRVMGGFLAIVLSAGVVFSTYELDGGLIHASVLAFALVKFFGAQSSLNHGIFQRDERLDYVAWSIFARGTLGLIAYGVAFWLWHNLPLALFCEAAAWFLTYYIVDLRLLTRLGAHTALAELTRSDPRHLMLLAWWILPIGVALWLTRASASVPTLVLERQAGLAAVGVFGALAYAHTALSMLANTLGSASAARLRRYFREGRHDHFWLLARKLTFVSAGFGGIAVAIAWVFGRPVIELVFGADYAERELLTLIVAASALALIASPLVTVVTAAQAFQARVYIALSMFLAGVVAAFALIPQYGAIGAAMSFGISNLFYLLATLIACRVLVKRSKV